MDFSEDTATVFDPRGFAHVGHITEQRDEQNGTALYYFPGDFIAGDGTEAWLDPFTASDAESLAEYLSCDDEVWTADRPEGVDYVVEAEDAEDAEAARPEVHVFELTATEVAARDEDTVWEYLKRPEFRLATMNGRDRERMLDTMVAELGITGGWYYRLGDDGTDEGPFETSKEARAAGEQAAEEWS